MLFFTDYLSEKNSRPVLVNTTVQPDGTATKFSLFNSVSEAFPAVVARVLAANMGSKASHGDDNTTTTAAAATTTTNATTTTTTDNEEEECVNKNFHGTPDSSSSSSDEHLQQHPHQQADDIVIINDKNYCPGTPDSSELSQAGTIKTTEC